MNRFSAPGPHNCENLALQLGGQGELPDIDLSSTGKDVLFMSLNSCSPTDYPVYLLLDIHNILIGILATVREKAGQALAAFVADPDALSFPLFLSPLRELRDLYASTASFAWVGTERSRGSVRF